MGAPHDGRTNEGRLARQQARRRRRERVTGIALAVLGAVVLVVAVVALRDPKHGAVTANGSQSSVAQQSQSTSVSASPRPSSSTKSSPRKHRTKSASSDAGSGAGSDAGSGATSGASSVKSVPLVVLNNTTTANLAKDAAARFEAGGWTVSDTGNLSNNIISTCTYYDESDDKAKAAAEALMEQFPTIKRTKPKFAELPDGPVVVVLTPDYSAG